MLYDANLDNPQPPPIPSTAWKIFLTSNVEREATFFSVKSNLTSNSYSWSTIYLIFPSSKLKNKDFLTYT